MSSFDLMRIGEQMSRTPIEKIMRNEEIKTIKNKDHNIIVNLPPNEVTHWVSVILGDRLGKT